MRAWNRLDAVVGLCLVALACSERNPRFQPAVTGDGPVEPGPVDPVDAHVLGDAHVPVDAQVPAEGPAPVDADEETDGDAIDPEPDTAVEVGGIDAPDSPPEVGGDLPPDAFVPPGGCGTRTAPVEAIMNADGVVVDTDGTLYMLTDDGTHSYVGRIPVGGTPDVRWLRIDNSPTTRGLGLDSANQRLFVLVVDARGALVMFRDIRGTPIGSVVQRPLDGGNDVVVGEDGTVYFGQDSDRHVYALRVGEASSRVTSAPVGSTLDQYPAALAFDPQGRLLVGMARGGPITRLTLTGGMESGRNEVGGWSGWANGLAFDRQQRLYVAAFHETQTQSVVRLGSGGPGGTTTITTGGRFSSIAFGRGALDCRDLYVAVPQGAMRRVRVADSL